MLDELGLAAEPPAAGKIDLNASATYRAALERVESVRRFLASREIAV